MLFFFSSIFALYLCVLLYYIFGWCLGHHKGASEQLKWDKSGL